MPRGDIIRRVVVALGGHERRGEYHGRSTPDFLLWGGEIGLADPNGPRPRHWFRRGDLFVVRKSFGDLIHTAVGLGLGRVPDAGLRFYLSCGGHAADMPKIVREGRQGFYFHAITTTAGRLRQWTFGPLEAREDRAAWDLFAGFLTHGEWRPLVDHLLETDPQFADKWAAFEAARKEAV